MNKHIRALALAFPLTAVAPLAHAADSASFSLVSNQDAFFGFYQTFNGLLKMNETVDFSFYGIFWTTESFGRAAGRVGDGVWTEFGGGANIRLLNGALTVKPQIGVLNGSLLSGGTRTDETSGNAVFDGIVPNLTINYADDRFEGEYYGGYYTATRNRDTQGLDFLHTWVNAGVKLSPRISLGGHYELLDNTYTGAPGPGSKVYEWIGGYAQFSLPMNVFARFTAGTDVDSDRGDFYKLAVGMTF